MAMLRPDLVVELIKRQMGQDIHYSFHGQDYTPESISALILRELARAAQEETGGQVCDVVITVPAFFGVLEREATRKAGQIAGLNVLAVLDEPVAAALAYQTIENYAETRHLFIYDLGGGTFDATVIRLEGNDIQVVCTDGDHHLGGADWDSKIMDFLLCGFTDQYPQLDPGEDEQFMQELAASAEQLKRALSHTLTSKHNVRLYGSVVQLELTREHMEELTSELLERTMEISERTIATAREKGVERFDDVLLVGGMTRTPAIAATLHERFKMEPKSYDPDQAVAKGAALYAAIQKAKIGMPADGKDETPQAPQSTADQPGVSVEQIAATAVASSALLPFIRTLAAKGADDVYLSLRRLNFSIHPRNANSSPPRGSVVRIADKVTKLLLELPPALTGDDQQSLHRLLESFVHHPPDLRARWLRVRPSNDGVGWNVQLTDEIPHDSIILEGSRPIDTSELKNNQIADLAVEPKHERIIELEHERKLLREIVKYLADEFTP